MKLLLKSALFSILVLQIGCSHVSTKNKSSGEVDQKVEDPQETAKRVSNRLKELVQAAKDSGEEKIRFLASDMYLKASAALMEGDYLTANLIFEHLVSLVPKDTFVKQKYAISLIRTGDLELSRKLLENVYSSSKKKDFRIGLVLAGVYTSLGETKLARATYSHLLRNYPRSEEPCIFLAKSYALEKKTKKAVNLLNSCQRKNRGKGIFSYYIGKIYVDLKSYKIAKTYFQKAIREEKDFSQAVMALGLIYEELGSQNLAMKTYKKYLRSNPNDSLILSRMVQLLFTQEKFKEVIPYAERLSDIDPENLNLRVKLGILYKDAGSFKKAISSFEGLLEFAPDNDKILYYLGGIYQEIQNYDKSIEFYGKIKNESGLYQDSSFQIAQMLSILAKNEYDNSKENGPKHQEFVEFIDGMIAKIKAFRVDFSIVKAAYFESLDENDEAIETLELVQSDKAFNIDHKFYLATLFEKEEEFNKSTEIVEKILEDDPKNAHAWNFLGYSLLERNESLDKAHKYIQKAVKLSPNDGYIRDSLGWYYFKKGDLEQAMNEVMEAVKLVPEDVSVNKHLAVIFSHMKNFKQAKVYLKKAIQTTSSEAEKAELVEVLKDLNQNRIPANYQLP